MSLLQLDFETGLREVFILFGVGIVGLNPHAEFRDFKNNHKAKGTLFVSWPHAFRTWVTRSVKFQQQRRG